MEQQRETVADVESDFSGAPLCVTLRAWQAASPSNMSRSCAHTRRYGSTTQKSSLMSGLQSRSGCSHSIQCQDDATGKGLHSSMHRNRLRDKTKLLKARLE
eukprot:1319662-Pleurochrysis_carterae.AAC.3